MGDGQFSLLSFHPLDPVRQILISSYLSSDPFFVQTFLWLFRRFTRPLDLITAIYKQLLILDDKKLGLGGVTAQMRYALSPSSCSDENPSYRC
jgi:hypothetical protein